MSREEIAFTAKFGVHKTYGSNTMITVGTFSKPEEAHLLRMRLEAGGVQAFIQDENMVQTDWLLSNAIGGVRVQIADEDAAAAKDILLEKYLSDSDPDMAQCPQCGSKDSAPDELPRRIAFLSILLFNLPFLFSKSRWKCNKCNYVWDEAKKRDPNNKGYIKGEK